MDSYEALLGTIGTLWKPWGRLNDDVNVAVYSMTNYSSEKHGSKTFIFNLGSSS